MPMFAHFEFKELPNGNLEITANGAMRTALRRESKEDGFDSDQKMYELFEGDLCNCEYDFCLPEFTGALTNAPMIAVFGQEKPLPEGADPRYHLITSNNGEHVFYSPVEKCWGFMEYETISLQRMLAEKGRAILTRGWQDRKDGRAST